MFAVLKTTNKGDIIINTENVSAVENVVDEKVLLEELKGSKTMLIVAINQTRVKYYYSKHSICEIMHFLRYGYYKDAFKKKNNDEI